MTGKAERMAARENHDPSNLSEEVMKGCMFWFSY